MQFAEQRIDPREKLALPVAIGNGLRAFTRDISASGMYLELRGDHHMQGTFLFEMHLDEPRMMFASEGVIVRIEHRDGFTGMAVRLVSPRLVLLD